MSSPSTRTVPASGVSSRLMQRRNVDFPDPDGPSMQTTSPRPTSRSIPRRTWWSPNDLWMPSAMTRGERSVPVATRQPPLEEALTDAEHRHQHEVPETRDHQQLDHAIVDRRDVL